MKLSRDEKLLYFIFRIKKKKQLIKCGNIRII